VFVNGEEGKEDEKEEGEEREGEEEKIACAYCGIKIIIKDSWPHVEGGSSLGVRKIDYFCSENHKMVFLSS
jgi:DNA-directed RNA polymerase subunit RPC12/RpoP